MLQKIVQIINNGSMKEPLMSQQQKDFAELVGYVTIVHAYIEQSLKYHAVFLCDDTEAEKVSELDGLGGQELIRAFIDHIHGLNLPPELIQQYESAVFDFEAISERRNAILKSQYDEHGDLLKEKNARKKLYNTLDPFLGKIDFTPIINLQEMEEIYMAIGRAYQAFDILELEVLAVQLEQK